VIPSAAIPGASALCAALSIASKRLRAVTLCLSSKVLSAFRGLWIGRSRSFLFKVAMGKMPKGPNGCHVPLSDLMVLN
jgi:hypothetical protein